jgi:outer membrane protein insertion porin family
LRNKIYFLGAITVIASILFFALMPNRTAYPVSSRFEGKIVKKIEFTAIRKLPNGGEEKIGSFDELMDSLYEKKEASFLLEKGQKVEYDVIMVGDRLDQTKIRDSIRVLFLTGRVSDVRVEVSELTDGVLINFVCEKRPVISRVEFKGLDTVQEADLSTRLLFKVGDSYRKDLVEKSLPQIRKKYAEAGFNNCVLDYKAEQDPDKDDGSILVTIIVDEGEDATIAKISILGAKKIPDYTLKGLMTLKEKGVTADGKFKREDFEMSKMRILMYYKERGYLDAEILDDPNQISYEWSNPEDTGSAVRAIYVTLKIREGERYFFDGYEVKGVSGTVGDDKSGKFITKERIESLLEMKKIDTNDTRERVGQFLSSPSSEFDPDTVLNYLQLQKDMYDIGFEYESYGRLGTQVIPTPKDRIEERTLNGKIEKRRFRKYILDIREGRRMYIEKILIRGCKKTKEKVVRREVIMKEESDEKAELYDSYKIQRTREKIYNLGFFKTVNIDTRPGTREDRVNIIIDVDEQPTGNISLGGAWGTAGGFSIFGTVGDTNFLGNGQNVSLKLNYGPKQTGITLGFTEPWFMDKPVALNVELFYERNQITDTSLFPSSDEEAVYLKQTIGYSVGPSYRFLYAANVGVDWVHSFSSIIDASGNCSDEVLMKKARGFTEKRAIVPFVGYNSIDNMLNPTRGINARFSTSFVGGFLVRGDEHYIMYSPSVELYYSPFHLPLLKNHLCVIQLRGSANFINPPLFRNKVEKYQNREREDWIDPDDRFTVGGPPGLRGWDYDTDSDLPSSWQKGLYHKIQYGAEFRIPIETQYLWTVLFFDAASLWTDSFWEKTLSPAEQEIFNEDKQNHKLYDIRDFRQVDVMSYFKYSYGFGFKIQIPMMPLRFWWGKKLEWQGAKNGFFKPISGYNFQFAIGDMQF